jgi:hypothetical protein
MLCVCGFVIGESGAYVCLGWNLHRNSYQFSSQVTPFEALYDRWYMSSIGWVEIGEFEPVSLELFKSSIEKVKLIYFV